jgi:transcription antitermination protein NusB
MADARRAALKDQTDISGARALIVEARFYDDIQDALLEGVLAELKAAGVSHDILTVPGALEIPAAVAIALDAAAGHGKPYDAVIALGCVVRGDTIHFEIVSMESSRALMDLAVSRKVPLGNGIITVNTDAQAWARARAGELNKAPSGEGLIMADSRKPVPKNPDKKANRRGAARLAAVQALYQMDIGGAGINDIFAEFESHWLGNEVEGDTYLPAEAAFFRDVVSGVVRDQGKLDPLIDEALSKGWPLKRIDAILRAVLRAGSYELEHRKDVPGRVVVSEYVDVAHAFVEAEETGMVNAVLDQIARQFRSDEFIRG